MESENVQTQQVPEFKETIPSKSESISNPLGLQDLYKAAFSQDTENNFGGYESNDNKGTITSTNLIEDTEEKFFNDKIDTILDKSEVYKSPNFDEPYQLYTLKGLQYSVDYVKSEENSLDLNQISYLEPKIEVEEALSNTVLNCNFQSYQSGPNSVLDLDKGVQIHIIKPDATSAEVTSPAANNSPSVTYTYESCEYSGDPQILQRYLSDSANVVHDSNTTCNQPVGTVTLNFVKKESSIFDKTFYDSDSVGVNPETLGVRFEDCEFNSSDSFASTESIIPKNIKCPKCPKKFMFKSDLLRHDKYKHSVKPKLFCKYCNKEFVSQQNLFFHEKSHKKKKSFYKCEVCKKTFKKSAVLVKHMAKKHSKSASFSCTNCEKIFTSQTLLNNHIRKIHLSDKEKPYKCEICLKGFERKQGLSCHAKAHLEEHPYACQYCNKTFSKSCYLRNHQKCHENEDKNIYKCGTCGKDFKTSNGLEEHSRKHTGEKPYMCNICMKNFASKAYFKIHMKKHAEEKHYSCTSCQETFTKLSDLSRHEKSHPNDKSFRCVNCSQEFCNQSSLILHWKKQLCNGNRCQEVCTQTTNILDAANIQNVSLQNVNVIVDPSFSNQSPIVLTSIEGVINSNSMPVILTQNSSGPYSVTSIT